MLVREIFRVLVDLRARGLSILLVEQNVRAALQVSDYGYVLEMGEVAAEGPSADLARDPRVLETYLGQRRRTCQRMTPALVPDREAAISDGARLPLRIWLRLLTCMNMTEAMVRARLHAQFATTLPRFDVLAALDAAGTELTMGALSARLMVTSGNVTGLVNAMEQDGLVTRRRHPEDGRSTLIGMTDAGRRAVFAHGAGTCTMDRASDGGAGPRGDGAALGHAGAPEGLGASGGIGTAVAHVASDEQGRVRHLVAL